MLSSQSYPSDYLLFVVYMDLTDDEEFQPTQELSHGQEDRIIDTVQSAPTDVWGILLSDGLTRRVDLRAPKAILGRCQQNALEGDVQYVRLGGAKTS